MNQPNGFLVSSYSKGRRGAGLIKRFDWAVQCQYEMNQWTAVRGSSDWLIDPKVHRPTGKIPGTPDYQSRPDLSAFRPVGIVMRC